jgi:hypothetical protein
MALKPLTQAEQDAILKAFGGGKAGFKKGANERFNADTEQRGSEKAKARILSADDIDALIYDTSRTLHTTLGITDEMRKQGIKSREITLEDLAAFAKNKETLQDKYQAGVTAAQIVELALDIDIQRSNNEIRNAIPVRFKGDMLHFITNASAESNVAQHYVMVQLKNIGSMAQRKGDPTQQAKKIAQSYLAFDCDCGRHTYWYRYIATIGGFNAGRAETGFPKVRNPHLVGIACKHVLRVMHTILMGDVRVIAQIKDMVKIIRKHDAPLNELPEHQLYADEVKKMAAKQNNLAHHKRNQVNRAANNPVLQRQIAKAAKAFTKAVEGNKEHEKEEIARIKKHGTTVEKLALRRVMENKLNHTKEVRKNSNDDILNDIYDIAIESLQNDINRLI